MDKNIDSLIPKIRSRGLTWNIPSNRTLPLKQVLIIYDRMIDISKRKKKLDIMTRSLIKTVCNLILKFNINDVLLALTKIAISKTHIWVIKIITDYAHSIKLSKNNEIFCIEALIIELIARFTLLV